MAFSLIVVCVGLPGEDDAYDFGTGAGRVAEVGFWVVIFYSLVLGFYVNATTPGYSQYYRMFDYVTKELPQIMQSNFKVDPSKKSIFGHSMGGHGALICALKLPNEYCSVSAFAPISNPVR